MMKAKKSMVMGGIFTALAILGLVFASCSNGTTSGGSHGETIEDAIQLREGVWASGNITADGEQWFKFTATSDIHQYLHFYQETLTDIYVQMYDNTGTATGEKDELYGSNTYTARTLSNGSMYYIKVTPINSYYFGTYKIAFNTTTTAPAITLPTQNITTLNANTWADGNIPTSNGEQWFKFTATSDIHQYLHFYQETLTDIYVQMYDNTGTAIGEKTTLHGSNPYTARTLSNGSMYYIKVTPDNGYFFGTYKIAFNTTTTAPAITLPTQNITTLNANTWADGNIPTSNGEQWFMFTATSDAQYIHFNLINLYDACVQLYDSTGTVTGERTILFGSNLYTARTLSNGSMYYIRVKQYKRADGGTYKIAFNTSTTAPSP